MELSRYATSPFGEARRTSGAHGYVAYFPRPIPRTMTLPLSTVRLLGDAEAALGRLAGVGQLLSNPRLLLRPYLLREALASTRIEGTQATMAEIFDADASGQAPDVDQEEVLNYVAALEWGLDHLAGLPLSSRLVREMHRRLMAGVRGRDRAPGEFRTSQNWIGGGGSKVADARFVPPPPQELHALMSDWERFANEESQLPLLVQNALLHSQFETIHPFLDGNGRLGRLLLVFFLQARGRLSAPLLYLSASLERDRQRYYDTLQILHESGDPVPWIELFLIAVQTQSIDAVDRAQRIVDLREQYRQAALGVGTANSLALAELVCERPLVTTRLVEEHLGVSRPTAVRLLRQLAEAGVLTEKGAGARGQRRYVANEMLAAVAGELSAD